MRHKSVLSVHPNNAAQQINSERKQQHAFTLIELAVVMAVVALCVVVVLPALARTRTNSPAAQCINNLRQLGTAWAVYSADTGRIVSSYAANSYKYSWCQGNADSSGTAGLYPYGGADPRGIQSGALWPYNKSLGLYRCPSDRRIAPSGAPNAGKPILRSISMNNWMNGYSYGDTPWTAQANTPAQAGSLRYRIFLKDAQITQPSQTYVFIDEEEKSINDGMFVVDVSGSSSYVLDIPAYRHSNGYGISFADTHAEIFQLFTKTMMSSPPISRLNIDFQRLAKVATYSN